jgi:Mg-chelatase subunit ChlD
MNFGNIATNDCVNVVPPPDPRCQDDAFRIANPDLCPTAPMLIIKPAVALACPLGSVQFRAVLVSRGQETDVTSQSIFTSGDPNIALVGATSGNATGLSQGETQISATYKGDVANAELTVLGSTCCDERHVAMMVLLDTSRSMSLTFSGAQGTKLKFSKTAATQFISEVNTKKDLVGLLHFNAAEVTIEAPPTSDKNSVAALVAPIPQTQQQTSFYDALKEGIAQLNSVTVGERVLVLFSDGEDTTPSYSDQNNPIALLDDFKSQGGIVICFGLRAQGKGFNFLEALTTGGFFINALPSNADEALGWLSGLKGYICAGNCTPEGDVMVAQGALRYNAFLNWDCVGGTSWFNLLGNGFFDFLPGNGLYVELWDLPFLTQPDNTSLTLKNPISLKSGHTYRLTAKLAGGQFIPPNLVLQTALRVFYLSGGNPVYLLNQSVTLPSASPLTDYAFSFTAPMDADVYISIQQITRGGISFLDQIKFEDTTDLITLFLDDFDAENVQYVPPRCGPGRTFLGYGYAYGYNCDGYGCLEEPPPAQMQDPNPLPDIEAGFQPPRLYKSTKTACASCGASQVNAPTTQLTPASDGVVGSTYTAIFDAATLVGGYSLKSDQAGAVASWDFDGSEDGMTWDTLNSHQAINFYDGETKLFLVAGATKYTYFRFTAFAAPISEIKLLAPAPAQICATASAESEVSQADADNQAVAAALAIAQPQLSCRQQFSSTQQYTATCPVGSFGQSVTKSATVTSLNSQGEADAEALAIAKADAEAALDCTGSNNTQDIVINDRTGAQPAPATPFPSVQHFSGLTGLITKVVVKIYGLTHTNPDDIIMVLRGPDGTTVALMANCGGSNAVSNIDITFDDTGGALPDSGLITPGTYAPTTYGPYAELPAPGPARPHGTTLSVFNGLGPNGSWSIWCADDTTLNDGDIALGYELIITSA